MRFEGHIGVAVADIFSHHDRQDTFIGESLQSFFNSNDASNHT
jgi:hypothetical protein